jgi:hypothetical protein
MLRAMFPQAAFLPRDRSIHATVNLRSLRIVSEVDALIDSGATDNFISPAVIEHFSIPTRPLARPVDIRNVDGTVNKKGKILNVADLVLRFRRKSHTQTFYIADLGDDHMILGMPFLAATNPDINWSKGSFFGKVEAATTDAHYRPLPPFAIEPEVMKDNLRSDQSRFEEFIADYTNDPPENQIMVRRTTKATTLAADAVDKTSRTWQEQVPTEYHKFGQVFSEEESQRFPGPRPWDHAIELVPDAPETLDCKTYPLAHGQQELLDQFIDEHLKKGYIRDSSSPYASPFFFVKKKDGKQRPVQDYRKLNQVTIRNTYPLPLIKELISHLVGKHWFTKFDIRWGYNNIRIKEGDQWKAAFKTNRGLFEPTVMFFGLTNSPATFQTMMNAIFRQEIATGDIIIYMDDILIATTGSLEYHRSKVAQVLQKLRDNDLFLKPEKCHFHKKEVEYLGVIVGKGQVKMDPIKVKGITDWPTPTNLSELRSFLGFGNYYKDFIPDYSRITRPLHDLTKKGVQWHWDDSEQHMFQLLKEIFTSYPVLQNPDPTKRYIVDTDTSQFAVGATISQEYPDGRHPIAYFSKSLLPAERNYNIYDRNYLLSFMP